MENLERFFSFLFVGGHPESADGCVTHLYPVESCGALYQICPMCCIAGIDSSVSDLSFADICVPAVWPGETSVG
jgi:hypothetical protein